MKKVYLKLQLHWQVFINNLVNFTSNNQHIFSDTLASVGTEIIQSPDPAPAPVPVTSPTQVPTTAPNPAPVPDSDPIDFPQQASDDIPCKV